MDNGKNCETVLIWLVNLNSFTDGSFISDFKFLLMVHTFPFCSYFLLGEMCVMNLLFSLLGGDSGSFAAQCQCPLVLYASMVLILPWPSRALRPLFPMKACAVDFDAPFVERGRGSPGTAYKRSEVKVGSRSYPGA